MAEKGFFRRGVSELMIARPDEAKGLIIYKHPDGTIPMKSQLTVEPDEVVIFFRDGKPGGAFTQPGRYTLDTGNIPFLSNFVDSFTGGNVLIAEAFFVTTREIPEVKFGARIGDLEDPKSGVAVQTMAHGTFALRVIDPTKLLVSLVGLGRADDNEQFLGWFRDLLQKTVRERVAELMVEKRMPLLDVTSGAMTSEIEAAILESVQRDVEPYGMRITRIGDFVIAIKEEDEAELKRLYKDAAYVRMAGGLQGFQQLAAGKAMMGAGEGMAKGGDGGGAAAAGAGVGVGFGMAQMFAQQAAAGTSVPQAPRHVPSDGVMHPGGPGGAPGAVTCGACQASVAPGKFCAECGQALAAAKKFCASCGKDLGAAKFCADCGTKA